MSGRQIAYLEDNDIVRQNYTDGLREQGFEVSGYHCREELMAHLDAALPDLVLLDVSQAQDRDAGFQVCGEVRRLSNELPIIFLTNRQSEIDRISGFRFGADDYISKDASLEYIVVRIEALLRRLDALCSASSPQAHKGNESDGIVLNEEHSTVHWKGRHVDMPLTQFWILRELCLHPGKVRNHRELMKAANVVVAPNTIAAHIKAIRRAFHDEDPAFQAIRTERGRGYRWILD